MDLKVERVAV